MSLRIDVCGNSETYRRPRVWVEHDWGCRFVWRPGDVDTKKSTGVERPFVAQPGTCHLNEGERGGDRRGYEPAFDVGPAGKSMVNDHEIVPRSAG